MFSETGKEDQLSEMSDWNVQVLKDSVFIQLYTHLYVFLTCLAFFLHQYDMYFVQMYV